AKQIRATEANYTTTFVAGDKIGLYVVDKNGRVLSANLPLTYNGTKWTGSAYYGGMGAKYFAYYPYQLDAVMNLNSVTATAIDAAAFFENLIKRWNIGIDQDTESKYTAYDLMTGNGVVTGIDTKNLSLSLTHQMALAVIEMPVIHYSLSTDPTYTWTSLLPDLNFINFSPLPMEGGYRYLINPHNGSLSLIGSYTKAQQTMEFVITTSAKPIAAKYDVYTVDGGTATIINKSHILTVGDFYMNDGSLLPAATITLTTAQQAACLGVVYWVGDIKNDNYTLLNSKFLGATHGLVVALWNMLAP
ncbi:MAG: fimbrillin family protein, partial [Bacteroidaceae bacterium]